MRVDRRMLAAVVDLTAFAGGYESLRRERKDPRAAGEVESFDAREQASRSIADYGSSTPTAEEPVRREEALSGIAAPCRRDDSTATCCCPCDLAESAWGRANFLIREKGFEVHQARSAVRRWLDVTNQDRRAGDAGHRGRCDVPSRTTAAAAWDERDRPSCAYPGTGG